MHQQFVFKWVLRFCTFWVIWLPVTAASKGFVESGVGNQKVRCFCSLVASSNSRGAARTGLSWRSVLSFPHTIPPRFLHSWYWFPGLRRALAESINKVDILHLHQVWAYSLWVAARLARQKGKPYLVTSYRIFSEPWHYAGFRKRLLFEIDRLRFWDTVVAVQ